MSRKPAGRPREPHPDPRIEAKLQRILSLRKMVADKEALVGQDHQQVTSLRAKIEAHPNWDRASYQREQIERLLDEIGEMEAEIRNLHDEIETRLAGIDDMDLTAL